jgi:hypothetical protein
VPSAIRERICFSSTGRARRRGLSVVDGAALDLTDELVDAGLERGACRVAAGVVPSRLSVTSTTFESALRCCPREAHDRASLRRPAAARRENLRLHNADAPGTRCSCP